MGLLVASRLCFYLIIVFFFVFFVSNAERYYDPATRRYIERQPMARQPRQAPPVTRLLTRQEIEAERERIRQEKLAEEERLRRVRESARTESRRRYDPNRYHNTEEVFFSSL